VRRALVCAGLAWLACPPLASAQLYVGRKVPHAGSAEISGGVAWTGGFDLGSVSAEETRNSTTDLSPFVLFTATSRTRPVIAAEARAGVFLSSALSVEAGLQYGRPTIATRVGDDAELAPDLTATETLTRIVVDGSAVLHFTGLSFGGGRGMPFVRAGGGYLRELHEKNEVIETGREYHAGGGVKLWFGRGKHRAGFRADGGVVMRTGGADTPDKKRTVPTAGVSLMYLF
jgi:hypothetical protein